MATAAATKIQIGGLRRGQLVALRKKATRLGTAPEAYVRELIKHDLAIDRLVATKSLSDIAAPFREAFKDTSEEEMGRLVDEARARHHRRLSKR